MTGKKAPNSMETKWGFIWKSTTNGYWVVTSRNKYHDKLFHRLVYEDFYGEIPEGDYHIHHIDGNKDNNCILNLQLVSNSEHGKIHYPNSNFNKYSGLKKEDSPKWKDYARIIKYGKRDGKQRYAIQYDGKDIKHSLYIHKLYKWFSKNYANEYLYCEV